MPQWCPLLHTGLVKHVSVATNMHTRVEELLGAVFSNQAASKLFKERQTSSWVLPKWEPSSMEVLGSVLVTGGCYQAMSR
jgi:hypothetical protein